MEFLSCVQEIALNHHEKWDGSGYPGKLVGDAIPVSARLMALADVYDALVSHRLYKQAMTHDQASAIIIEGRGKHFDPDVVDAFVAVSKDLAIIADRYSDAPTASQRNLSGAAAVTNDPNADGPLSLERLKVVAGGSAVDQEVLSP